MTRADHQSGTDRIAEVAAQLDAELIVNVQGMSPRLSRKRFSRSSTYWSSILGWYVDLRRGQRRTARPQRGQSDCRR